MRKLQNLVLLHGIGLLGTLGGLGGIGPGGIRLGGVANASTSVEVDLRAQRAYLLNDGRKVAQSPISSGRDGHQTARGNFRVLEKELNHRSSTYGRVVANNGRVLVGDANSRTPVPQGASFVEAPMPYFMRFTGPFGMHAGYLPGYRASHGCVRLPTDMAALFYSSVQVGTPVRVY